MALAGVAVGAVATVVLVRLVRSYLYDVRVYGVQTIDPLVLAGTALLLLAVVALASYVPARRSARIEPSRVLRIE
jgi:ABC-type lipoprotein release transport system permease subunit